MSGLFYLEINSNLLYRGVYSGQIFIQANGYNNAIIGRDELGIDNNYIIYANVHQQYFESANTANINIEIGYVISEDNSKINLSFYNNTTSDRLFAYQVEVLFCKNKP